MVDWVDLVDVIVLCETWVDRRGCEKVRYLLPKGYIFRVVQWAKRKNKKGRAKGGMILRIRRELRMEKDKRKESREGIITTKLEIGNEWWRIVGIYVNKDLSKKLDELKEWLEERGNEEEGGDFNARTGKERGKEER